jgi:endoglucanase
MTSLIARRLVGVAVCALVVSPLACREDPEPPDGVAGAGGGPSGSGGRGGSTAGRGGSTAGSGGATAGSGGTAVDAPAPDSAPGPDARPPEVSPGGDGPTTPATDAPAGEGGGGVAAAMRPFFSHPMAYPAGTIRPSNCTPAGVDAGATDAGSAGCAQATLDQAVMAFYEKWKTAYVRNITSGACTGFTYIDSPDDFGSQQTVSSLQGLGMLVTVIMATGQDARAAYDGMFKYVRRFKSAKNPKLMARDIPSGCPAMIMGAESQTDGDLDIALSLLMADRQWGSGGAINYLAEARDIIGAIKVSEMTLAGLPTLGDWVANGQNPTDAGVAADPKFSVGLRSSDLMGGHFRAFGTITSDMFWVGAIDAGHSVLRTFQDNVSTVTGLVPDFMVNVTTMPAAAPANWSGPNQPNDGRYSYTAARLPMRLAADYLTATGEPANRVKGIITRINDWIAVTKTMGNPAMIRDGYRLDDSSALGTGGSFLFEGAFGAAAIVDAKYQAWLDAIWNRVSVGNVNNPPDSHTDSIRLLSMIIMSGNWWAP